MVDKRITTKSMEKQAIDCLVYDVTTVMRERMRGAFIDGKRGWDDKSNIEEYKRLAAQKVAEGDWIDAMNLVAIIWNLEKPE